MTYPLSTWYMVAWAEEVDAAPLPPCSTGRSSSTAMPTAPHALFDRCPHRFAPLSIGSVDGDAVVCRHHGLAFGPDGACVRNPHGPLSRALAVPTHPLVKAHRALWIWFGDPARADPAAIRDLAFLTAVPETVLSKGYLCGHGHYQLFVDNILDLTYTDYPHPDTLGGGSITRTPSRGRGPAPPGVDHIDSWTEVEWSAPGVMKQINASSRRHAACQGR